MNRKILAGVSLGILFTAFGIISLLVVITKRHPYFVNKKLRIGALIISLTGISTGYPGFSCCYAPINRPMGDVLIVDQVDKQTGKIVVKKSISDSITGEIVDRQGNEFSYVIADSTDQIVFKENLAPADGAFDENTEEFTIRFGNTILPGNYNLKFYAVQKDSIKNIDLYARSYPLKITE